jgi:hypothetical protein
MSMAAFEDSAYDDMTTSYKDTGTPDGNDIYICIDSFVSSV